MHDVRFALRVLLKNPGFALAAVAALALGIGANSAIFTIVNAVLFRSLPYPNAERMVMVWETNRDVNPNTFPDPKRVAAMKHWFVVSRNFERWEQQQHSFEDLAGFYPRVVTLTGAGDPERLRALAVTPGFFSLVGARPAMGRAFLAEENAPGRDEVAVLGHGLWQRQFASDPKALGATVMVDGLPHTIIGILPAGFQVVLPNMPRQFDLLLPMEHVMQGQGQRRFAIFEAAGRLKPAVAIAQAQSEMDAIALRLEKELPRNKGRGVSLVPLRQEIAGDVKPALLLLLGAVGCVLLIACVNVANLLLARAAARQREIGVRAVLGAGRFRLIRQLLVESVLLGLVGGLGGVLLARWGVTALIALMPKGLIPRVEDIALDVRVLGFVFLLSVAAGVLFGLVPAIQATRGELSQSLKEGGGRTTAGGSRRLRRALVISEVAIALVLAAGAGLLVRSFLRLRAVELGYRPENVLTLNLPLSEVTYKDSLQRAAFVDQVLDRVQSLPAVLSAGCTNSLPMGSGWTTSYGVTIEGRPDTDTHVYFRTITPGYFRTIGMHVTKGRLFTAADMKADRVIINEAMVRRFWPDTPGGSPEPLGRRIRFGGPWREIIGVVSDIKFDRLDSDTSPEAYVPFTENITPAAALVVRTPSDPMRLVPAIRSAIRAVDRNQPVEYVQTMEQLLDEAVARPRFHMLVIGIFAGLALALAAVGIYGVTAYSVAQRTHEIGVRLALGAGARNVLLSVIGEACLLALAGVGIGVAGAFAATRVLSSFLFGVKPTDAATFAAVALLLVAVAAAASYIPARRATRVDPIIALRYE